MKYNYLVKHNGVLYPSGTEVPEGDTPVTVKSEDNNAEDSTQGEVETKNESENEPGSESEDDEEEENESENQPKYSRSQIQQMNNESLRAVAEEIGVEFDDNTTGKELKVLIMAKLGV